MPLLTFNRNRGWIQQPLCGVLTFERLGGAGA